MTIRQAIERIDSQKHNIYSQNDKIVWLSRVDALVKMLIIDAHEGGEEVLFEGYDDSTDPERELLVPAPFDELYLRWLEARMDYLNGEYDRYNNAMEMYQTLWDSYVNHYRRIHMPKGGEFRYF